MTDTAPVECVVQHSTVPDVWTTVITGTWERPLPLEPARAVVRGLREAMLDGDWRVLERGPDGKWRTRDEAAAWKLRQRGSRPDWSEWDDTPVPTPEP